MAQQHVDGDGVAIGQRSRQLRQPPGDGVVDGERAFLLKLQDHGRGHQLGVAADLVVRVCRQRFARRHVGHAGGLEIATGRRDGEQRDARRRVRAGIQEGGERLVQAGRDLGRQRRFDRVERGRRFRRTDRAPW